MNPAFPSKASEVVADRGGFGSSGAVAVGLVAALVFALAYLSPVEAVDADPAVALLGSQALIDHQSLRLDPYVGREGLAYDLEDDYRVRSHAGAHYPNSVGVPVLSVPAVWLANLAGFEMLDQDAEFALQNLLSAAACALLFVMLFRLCRLYLEAPASLVVAAVSMLGTSLMSTGATGLWNSDYSLIFITAALHHIAARRGRGMSAGNLAYLVGLLIVGFFCRPSTGFFALAVLIYLLGEPDRRIRVVAGVGLMGIGLALAVPSIVPLPWMAAHYSPARLRFTYPVGAGLYGVLLSPSRGLFVFSPLLALVVAGSSRYARDLWRHRVFRLCVVWVAIHTLAVATNEGKWWGGHSFGPRMLIDVVPAFVVVTCLVWRHLRCEAARPTRRRLAAAYVLLGVVSIAVHSGQGLFNPATRLWNINPDIDRDPALALDWRYPQFLASPAMLEARLDDYEARMVERRRGSLPTYVLGTPIEHDAEEVVFAHWYAAEPGWRWTRGDRAVIIVHLPIIDPDKLHVLQVRAGSLGDQQVAVRVNGTPVASFRMVGFEPSWHLAAVPGGVLESTAENTIELGVGAPGSTPDDPRALGVALRQLRLVSVADDQSAVTYADDPYFGTGFSQAEEGWRWTDGTRAVLSVPVGAVAPGGDYFAIVRGRSYGEQRVGVAVNGMAIGEVELTGERTDSIALAFAARLLRPNAINLLEFRLPDAATPPGESRRLGLAVASATIAPDAAVGPAR